MSGLLYNAYTKFKPETFVALLTEQVQKNYPGAKLNVGKVGYRFSIDFNLKLQDIHLRRSGKILGSIGEVELKIPWWLLLFNRGNAQINLSRLDIYIDHGSSAPTRVSVAPAAPVAATQVKVAIPSYLAEAKFTLRAKDLSVRDINNARRFFTVSKLLVREFQYGKNSAFEINIPIEITHGQVKYLSNLWLFGDVTPEPSLWKLKYRGEFRTRESNDKFQIEDLVINGTSSFVPATLAIDSKINLFNEKVPIGNGQLMANQDNLLLNLNFSKLPLSYFEFIYEFIRNPYLPKLAGHAEGEVKFEKSFNDSAAEVVGKLNFDGDIFLGSGNQMAGKWLLGFQNNRWEVSFISPKGEASFLRRSFLDVSNNHVGQYIEELSFSDVDFNTVVGVVQPLSRVMNELPDSYYRTSISYKNCLQGEEVVDGSFRYGNSPGQKFYQAELSSGKSAFNINYADKNKKKSLDLLATHFNWHPTYTFLQPYYYTSSGVIDGKLEGRWDTGLQSGKWLMKMTVKDINEARGKLPEFITKTAELLDLKAQDFKQSGINLSVRNNILTLNSLLLGNTQSAKITGSLSTKQKSTLTLSYPQNKKFKPIKREVIEPYWIEKEEI
jgi:hypothetical protein